MFCSVRAHDACHSDAVAEPVLTCQQLVVVRGGTTVLDGLDVEVGAGRITGLLGPSGCGKTTFLRSVIGTQRITSGTVRVLGRPAGDPALRREIGYASQQASVYDDLTVAQNIAYFAVAVGAPKTDVERVIGQVDLGKYADRLTGRLSGGQRSRVSLAVAMLGTPRLLALDEPTVGHDPVLREDLLRLFGELAAAGLTLLVSSHVMDEAERCDELVLMREGHILAHESPAALKQRTGAATMDAAFLRLVRDGAAA
jgi:ABC-2 type transport system ATP-binding protein